MAGFLDALGFLTTAPLPRGRTGSLAGSAARWFVPVGLLLGGALAIASLGTYWAWPGPVAAAAVVAAWTGLTGALHLDGVADTADAAFASVSRERRIEILRDVHHGTFGIVAIAMVVLLKWSALASFSGREAAAGAVVACVAGRAALLPILGRFASPRPGGMAATMREGATPLATAAGLSIALGIGLLSYGPAGAGVVAGTIIASLLVAAWLARRFGGISGDACGAIVETAEMLALLAVSALVNHGWAHAFPYGPGQ